MKRILSIIAVLFTATILSGSGNKSSVWKYELPLSFYGEFDSIPTINQFGQVRNGIIVDNIISVYNADPNGFDLTNTQIEAFRMLVGGMYTTGTWQKCKAIYPFIGGSEYKHKWNIKDLRDLDAAYRLSFNGANQINNSFGYRNNQNGGFANTFLTSNDVGLNSNATGLYLTTTSNSGAGTLFGYIGFGSDYHLTFNTVAWFFRNNMNSNSGNVLQPYVNKTRMIQLIRTSSTNTVIYENDRLSFSQTATAITKPSNIPLYLGAYRNSTGTATDLSGYTIGFFYFSPNGISGTEAIRLSNIVTQVQRHLSRQ